jgi:hypothetical protein
VVVVPTQAATKRMAATLCVGGSGCFATIQAAVDAAHDGDTIKINPGTFAGGVQIAKSVNLVGAGAARTIIKGGGTVLTLGTLDGTTQPAAISIRGVTITGGLNRNLPDGPGSSAALGGGVFIPATLGLDGTSPGPTVTIADSVITGNRVQPDGSADFGLPCPDGFKCPFAFAGGGGIDSHGNLTLVNTIVSDNKAFTDTGFAGGGGIRQTEGSLTLRHSVVTRNESVVTPPYGQYPYGAGIIVDGGSGAIVISDSVISDNRVSMTSVYPVGALTNSTGAALDFDENHTGPVTVTDTRITGNVASGFDAAGDGSASSIVYINSGSPLTMRNTVISGNHTIANGAANVFGGVIFEVNSSSVITSTAITGNTISVTSTGDATSVGAVVTGSQDPVVFVDSLVAGNTAQISGQTSVSTFGVGVENFGVLQLQRTRVTDNSVRATGSSGQVSGGGIWNGQLVDGLLPQLTLTDSAVARNSISGSLGLTVQGGGLFTTSPVTLQHSVIAQNMPDQCYGC